MPPRRAIDWTLKHLRELLETAEQENVMLEYKASLAIGDWTDSRRNDLAREVAAFANSAGGTIVIGIGEVEHKPAVIDGGTDTRLVSKESLESALRARIAPRIDNLTIKEIPNPEKPFFAYFVIGVPRSMRAPHMVSPIHRYYKRYNFECVPMEHYEVEDVRRRQSEPDLTFICQLDATGETSPDGRRVYILQAGVLNEGSVIARDVLVRIYIPRSLMGFATWSPNGQQQHAIYNGVAVERFDAYVRDSAGPIPIYPKDDQPFLVTRARGRRIFLHLPEPLQPELAQARIIAQVFADGMRMRSIDLTVEELVAHKNVTGGNGQS